MPTESGAEAAVVGSGPNGFAAALTLASAGIQVDLFEARETVGGGMRSGELTLEGFVHDICSAIQPLGMASPFFAGLELERFGLRWIQPEIPMAHPLEGRAAALRRSLDDTARGLGSDARAYARVMRPLVRNHEALLKELLGPLRPPRHPIAMANFGLRALQSANLFVRRFDSDAARGMFTGMAAHSMLKMTQPTTAAFGLMLAMLGHAVGWPIPEGGSGQLAEALRALAESKGIRIHTDRRIDSLRQISGYRSVLLDVTPKQLVQMAGTDLPSSYRRRMSRYRYGPGVFKLDLALDGPVPWSAEECLRAGTVHVGGTHEEIMRSEHQVWEGKHPEAPFLLVAQQSLFDNTRAPEGKHTLWSYCHVPSGSDFDMSERMESQIERFAPGFRDRIIARSKMTALEMQVYNPNYVGGDINGGIQDLRQLFTRPVARLDPYSTPMPGVFICSSSTPPGGGVHGMCGYWAAKSSLRKVFGVRLKD